MRGDHEGVSVDDTVEEASVDDAVEEVSVVAAVEEAFMSSRSRLAGGMKAHP